jgi:hypothetical protein
MDRLPHCRFHRRVLADLDRPSNTGDSPASSVILVTRSPSPFLKFPFVAPPGAPELNQRKLSPVALPPGR